MALAIRLPKVGDGDLSEEPQARLCAFIASVGAFCWDDPLRAEPLVANLCAPLVREPKLLMAALRAQAPRRIRERLNERTDLPIPLCLASVAVDLARSARMSRTEACWCVRTIASAQGLVPYWAHDVDLVGLCSEALPEWIRSQSHRGASEPTAPAHGARSVFDTPAGSVAPEEPSEWSWAAFLAGPAWMWASGLRIPALAYVAVALTLCGLRAWEVYAAAMLVVHAFLGITGAALAAGRLSPSQSRAGVAMPLAPHRVWIGAGAAVLALEMLAVTAGLIAAHPAASPSSRPVVTQADQVALLGARP